LAYSLILKVEATHFVQMSVNLSWVEWSRVPEDNCTHIFLLLSIPQSRSSWWGFSGPASAYSECCEWIQVPGCRILLLGPR
jgi:hypothetical protein